MKTKIKICSFAIIMFIGSCVNYNNKIATIKNNTSGVIACELLKNGLITDSSLFKDTSYMSYLIKPQHYDNYTVPDSNLTKAPDSAKTYIYILNLDSINKFRKSGIKNGIFYHSLMKKIVIQLNKVHEPVDTIYAK